jgi:hypothetical protein
LVVPRSMPINLLIFLPGLLSFWNLAGCPTDG